MAELEQRVQQLESELRELQAMLKTDREQIDHLTSRVDRFYPEKIHGPPAKDIQRAFGGRLFGLVGHRGEYGGWGGGPEALTHLSLRFTVQGKDVQVETARHEPLEPPLVPLALRALTHVGPDGTITEPPLPLTLTFEERAARLRVGGREHDFKSFVCGDHAIAYGPVGDLWVTVHLPTAFLDGQAFELDDEAEFRWGDEPEGAQ
jgi:hypothetical protein